MPANQAPLDRAIRAVIATSLLIGSVLVGIGTLDNVMLMIIGLSVAGTAATGSCPLYAFYGISTAQWPPTFADQAPDRPGTCGRNRCTMTRYPTDAHTTAASTTIPHLEAPAHGPGPGHRGEHPC